MVQNPRSTGKHHFYLFIGQVMIGDRLTGGDCQIGNKRAGCGQNHWV